MTETPATPTGTPTIESLEQGERPFVLADHMGRVLGMNASFTRTFGWTLESLEGQPLSLILPEAFQMSHQLGFSRFQATGHSTILAHPLRLATICSDGRTIVSEHFIVAEQRRGQWVFGATLTPLEQDPSAP
ncbi:MAG: PAS domain S-box protein [Cyanobacteriota bacterium]